MASILDALKYPWHKPEAQQLHATLSELNPTTELALLAAEQAEIKRTSINANQAPDLIWADILRASAPLGVTRLLVQQAHDRLNSRSPFKPFFANLLADRPVEIEVETGQSPFLHGTDEISTQEALLFQDDLMIEIGKVPALVTTLKTLVMLAPSVCKLSVDINGMLKRGTGFRIDKDMLLTNHHVFHKADDTRATAVTAEFGYEDDGVGGVLTATAVPCDVSTVLASKDDDWAVIRTKQPLDDKWPVVKLSTGVAPTASSSAYIIQHPSGERKRLGFVRNKVSEFDERVVKYLTDTMEGSSGAPVFDADGKIIALHHVGGKPQEIIGKPPLKKNEGIRVSRIVEGLKAQGVNPP